MTSTTVTPTLTSPDPVYAAIEAHRQAQVRLGEAVHIESELEFSLPKDRRRSRATVDGEQVAEGDDPRWIAAIRATAKACSDSSATESAFLDVEPTTIAGIVALLRYSHEFARRNGEDLIEPSTVFEDDDGREISGQALLHRNLADAIERIEGAAS